MSAPERRVTSHESRVTWRLLRGRLDLDRPGVVGILNVTPDSFSDGGLHDTTVNARARAGEMVEEGADVIDIGGESTRPGSVPVSLEDEIARVIPVVRAVRRDHPALVISIDTTKSAVARAALHEGADIVNDVSALRLDAAMGAVVAAAGAGIILMHSRGGVGELASYTHADYGGDPVSAVAAELTEGVRRARAAQIPDDAIVLDPGIGFSKRADDSVAVLRALPQLAALGFPLLVGASRKRVVEELTGESDPTRRDAGSIGLHVAALARGARLFRVHDVRSHRHALDCAWAVLRAVDA